MKSYRRLLMFPSRSMLSMLLITRAITFHVTQTTLPWQRHRRTADRQTDRQRTVTIARFAPYASRGRNNADDKCSIHRVSREKYIIELKLSKVITPNTFHILHLSVLQKR